MEKITFKRLGVEGFGSIQEPLNFALDREGITMLCGANGSGKTTLLSSLYWGLYGDMLKDVLAADIPTKVDDRGKNFRGTRVIVDFSKGNKDYRVVRHLKFEGTTKGLKGGDSVMVFEKESSDWDFTAEHLSGSTKGVVDTSKKIAEILGLSSKAFLNSFLFGQRMKRLIESDGKDKRALFEELFEMTFIEGAKKKAEAEANKLEFGISTAEAALIAEANSVTDLENSIQQQETIIASWEAQHEEDVKSCKESVRKEEETLATLQESYEVLEKKAADYDVDKEDVLRAAKNDSKHVLTAAEVAENNVKGLILQSDRVIADQNGRLNALEDSLKNVEKNCPACGTPLKADEIAEVEKKIKESISNETEALKVLRQSRKDLDETLKVRKKSVEAAKAVSDKAVSDYEVYISSVAELKQAFMDLKVVKANVAAQRKAVSNAKLLLERSEEKKMPDFQLEAAKQKLKDKKESIAETEKAIEALKGKLDKVQWWIKKGFGASGLKAYIFNAMLNRLNLYIEQYAELLGVSVRFSVDMSKASKPFITTCYFKGRQVDYNTLSGGEKQRVDVAISFAMHDLVSSSANLNLLILDEVFEGLDADGVESVYELVRLKAEAGKSIYIVTHAVELDSTLTKRVLFLYDKEKKTTVIS